MIAAVNARPGMSVGGGFVASDYTRVANGEPTPAGFTALDWAIVAWLRGGPLP